MGRADGSAVFLAAREPLLTVREARHLDHRKVLVHATLDNDRRLEATPRRLLWAARRRARGSWRFWLNGWSSAASCRRDLHVSRGRSRSIRGVRRRPRRARGAAAPRRPAADTPCSRSAVGLGGGDAARGGGRPIAAAGPWSWDSAAASIALAPLLCPRPGGTGSRACSGERRRRSPAGPVSPRRCSSARGAPALGVGWAVGFLVVLLAGAVVVLFMLDEQQLPDAEPLLVLPPRAVLTWTRPPRRRPEPWRSWLSLVLAC